MYYKYIPLLLDIVYKSFGANTVPNVIRTICAFNYNIYTSYFFNSKFYWIFFFKKIEKNQIINTKKLKKILNVFQVHQI